MNTINNTITKFAPVVGRALIGLVYMANGIGLSISFLPVAAMLESRGIPASIPLLTLVILAWLIGSICIIFGWRFRLMASGLFLLTIPVLVGMHAPWNADSASFQNELNHFLKGMAMLGGLAYLAAFGPGEFHLGKTREVAREGK